jgi:hypothetical protein
MHCDSQILYAWYSWNELNKRRDIMRDWKLHNAIFDNFTMSMSVTIDGFWIHDRIYWTLWYSAWLLFTVHCYTNTSVHSHASSSCCLVAASSGGWSHSFWFPNCPWPQLSSHSNRSQQLNPNRYLTDRLTHTLTNQLFTNSTQLTLTNCSAYNISHGPCRRHRSSVAVYGPLPSNGCTCNIIYTYEERSPLRLSYVQTCFGTIQNKDNRHGYQF